MGSVRSMWIGRKRVIVRRILIFWVGGRGGVVVRGVVDDWWLRRLARRVRRVFR